MQRRRELADGLIRQGQWLQAQQVLEGVVRSPASDATAWNLLAYTLAMQGNLDQAARVCLEAARLHPTDPAAHANLGNIRRDQNRLEEAVACYERAIALDPKLAEVHRALGNVHRQLGRRSAAIASYRTALALEPSQADSHAYLGKLLADEGGHEEALACYQRAVELQPRFAEAWNALGLASWMMLRLPEAERAFRQAVEQDAQLVDAKLNLALLLMLRGNYEEGLPLYEARLHGHPQLAALAGVRRWQGEPLSGETLFLWEDEGLGDAMMMLRYAAALRAKGSGKVVLSCSQPLLRLAASVRGVDQVVLNTGAVQLGNAVVHCPLSSLPLALATRVDSVPRDVPYLAVPQQLKAVWKERLAALSGLRVGLVWNGSSIYKRSALRNIPLEAFAPLASVPNVHLVSLQKGEAALEAKRLPGLITSHIEECGDFLDTGALVEALDIVVSVDTSVAHLAGALGKPVWLLNRYESEWRWGLEREDSIWYPTLRIFRQQRHGDWAEPIGRAAAALAAWQRP